MSLPSKVGAYEIVSLLGAGGMGEVYLARDKKLARDVAIKVLKTDGPRTAELVRRFEHEALAASALNHPNIVTVYETGETKDGAFIAMELVEGKRLSEMLNAGPLSARRLLPIAAQIADGLAAAHAKGIVHRDLKPDNIMITREGRVKLLDFGLAKLVMPDPSEREDMPTLNMAEMKTRPGTILGTVGYMSPEQAGGRDVDFRSDQFSFGSILYEMASGVRAFDGPAAVETMAAVIREEPPSLADNKDVPTPLRWVIERCLAKDPEDRYAATRDLLRDLETLRDNIADISGLSLPSSRAKPAARSAIRMLLPFGLAAALVLLGTFAGFLVARRAGPREPASSRPITYSGRDREPAISPDGRTIAFSSSRDGRPRIWLKQLSDGSEAALTSGPDSAPQFTPDGGGVLFARREGGAFSLYRASLVGGEARRLVPDASFGRLSPDGKKLVFLRSEPGHVLEVSLYVAEADGGNARLLRHLDFEMRDFAFSPDGARIALVEAAGSGRRENLRILSADGKDVTVVAPPVVRGPILAATWNGSGNEVVYVQAEGSVGANARARVALRNLRSGVDRTLFWTPSAASRIAVAGEGALAFDSIAIRGSLVEMPLAPAPGEARWLTRGTCRDRQPVYSPDGGSLVFSSERGGNMDIWSLTLATGALHRLTDHPAEDWDPAFTRDGRSLLFSSRRSGTFEVHLANADGSGPHQVTHDGSDAENPTATSDGEWIVYVNQIKAEIWKVRKDGTEATKLWTGPVNQTEVSPDGRWVAFPSFVSGVSFLVRVVRVADGALLPFRIPVERKGSNTTAGMGRPRWMPDGKAIAFVGVDDEGRTGIFSQDFAPDREDTTPTRRKVAGFNAEYTTESFGISPDGKRITISAAEEEGTLMLAENVTGIHASPR